MDEYGRVRRTRCLLALLASGLALGSAPTVTLNRPAPTAGVDDWNRYLAAVIKTHDAAEEVVSLNTLLRNWGASFSNQSNATIARVLFDTDDARLGQLRVEMLWRVFDLRWRGNDGLEPSNAWRDLSLALLEEGQQGDALEVAAHVKNPYDIVIMHVDNRYRPLLRAPGLESDVDKAARADIEVRRRYSTSNPHRLYLLLSLARGLLATPSGAEEALRLTTEAVQKIKGDAQHSAYEDAEEELPFLYQVQGSALFALGRYDEAVAQLRSGVNLFKKSPNNVQLSLAWELSRIGKPTEALSALSDEESLNWLARAFAQEVRASAACQLGDASMLEKSLEYLQQHKNETPEFYEHALIVCDRLEEAAGVLLWRVTTPELRADALRELQNYGQRPAPALVLQWRERLQKLRDRPELRTQIALVGRIGRFALSPVTF